MKTVSDACFPGAVADRRRVLMLMNPGRVSRFYLAGLASGASQLGIDVRTVELGSIWSQPHVPREQIAREMLSIIERENIGLVISYTFNGVFDLAVVRDSAGRETGIFGFAGVPHLMLWTDHPQWAHERAALQRSVQPLLRQPHQHHFVKAPYAADEVRRFLGWEHVYGLSVGEDPSLVHPARDVQADFDVVAVVGSPPYVPEEIAPFLDQRNPDSDAIVGVVAGRTTRMLDDLWRRRAPERLQDKLIRLGRDWIAAKRCDPRRASFRHYENVANGHEDAAAFLSDHYEMYFDALHVMWEFGRWQRAFMALYLSRFFKVAVFGQDWSSVGLPGGGGWVSYDQQAAVYARGRLALNVNQCNDEEGLSHKAFQITASGVPCLHLDRPGVADHFEPGREIALFDGPTEARDRAAELLADDARRSDLGSRGLDRFLRNHTWSSRLKHMLVAMHGATAPADREHAAKAEARKAGLCSAFDLESENRDVVARVQ